MPLVLQVCTCSSYTPHQDLCFDELKNVRQDFLNFLLVRFSACVFLILSAVVRVVITTGLLAWVIQGQRVAFQDCMGQEPVKGRDGVMGKQEWRGRDLAGYGRARSLE